ncbi:hypothetical protein WME97_48730 [Sorangium sp. So ce367]|uniref:tetratricopeptide repeat protein n=1 Tax=Sorangium sp. So ce367 TaxID=3133305 RepID=UPI003F5F5AE0
MRNHHIPGALALCLLVGRAAWAAPPRDPVKAEALFQAGRQEMQRGEFASACPRFRESYRLDPKPGALLNLANCEEKLGQIADAWGHFRRAIELLPTSDDRVPVAKQRMRDLERRVPRLTVVASGSLPPGTEILFDDTPLGEGALGVAFPVNPGERTIVVRAPGHREETFRVRVKEKAAERLEVHAGAKLPPASAPAAQTTMPGASQPPGSPWSSLVKSPRRGAGLAVGGVGVVSLGVGVVTGLMALERASIVKDPAHCDGETWCDAEGVAAASSGETLSAVSTVTFIAGIACIGASVALFLTEPKADGTSAGTGLTLGVGSHGNGAFARFGGRF